MAEQDRTPIVNRSAMTEFIERGLGIDPHYVSRVMLRPDAVTVWCYRLDAEGNKQIEYDPSTGDSYSITDATHFTVVG